MLEREVKAYLLKRVKELGGEARKVRWEGRRNAPDWRVMIPGHQPFWLELKAMGEKPTAAQTREAQRMGALDEICEWASSPRAIDNIIEWAKNG